MVSLKSKIIGGSVAAVALAGALLAPFEGTRYTAYKDPVGIWTICEGHTPGVKPGDVATKAQCAEYKRQDLEYAAGIVKQCYTGPLTVGQEAALISFTYNVGPGRAGVKDGSCVLKSGAQPSIRRLFNAGQGTAACNELPKWNAQRLPGITKRREAERRVCLS